MEPSREACRLAVERSGITLHRGTLDDRSFGDGFDVVTLHDLWSPHNSNWFAIAEAA